MSFKNECDMRHELQEPKNAKTFFLPWVCDGYSVLADELLDFKPQDWLTVASSTKCWKDMLEGHAFMLPALKMAEWPLPFPTYHCPC